MFLRTGLVLDMLNLIFGSSQFIRVLGIWLYYSGSLIQNYFKFKVCDWPIWKDIVKNSPKSLTIMSNTGTPWNTLSVAQAVTLCENP